MDSKRLAMVGGSVRKELMNVQVQTVRIMSEYLCQQNQVRGFDITDAAQVCTDWQDNDKPLAVPYNR